MKCPGCTTEMATMVIREVEIDRCPGCGGIALDKGEAETIDALGLAHVIEGGVVATLQHRQTPATCHACSKEMIALRGAGDVEYDWCDSCERLFFDRGELTALGAFSDI